MNPHKTKLSFDLALAGTGGTSGGGGGGGGGALVPASLYRDGTGAAFIKWCGLLINAASLEVQGDYTRWVVWAGGSGICCPGSVLRASVRLT